MRFSGLNTVRQPRLLVNDSPDSRNSLVGSNGKIITRPGVAKYTGIGLGSGIGAIFNIKSDDCRNNYKIAIDMSGRVIEDPENYKWGLPEENFLGGYWRFEDASGDVYDEITESTYGVYNGSQYQLPGKVNYGLGFAGIDYVVKWDNTPVFNLPGDFTVFFWVYPTTIAPAYQALIMVNAHYGFYLRMKGNKIAVLISNVGDRFWTDNVEGANPVFTANKWNFVSCVRSGSDVTVKVNMVTGVSVTNGDPIKYSADADSGFGFEADLNGNFYGGAATWPLSGTVDELVVYNGIALTDGELLNYYNWTK